MSLFARFFTACVLLFSGAGLISGQQIYVATGSSGTAGTLYQFNVATQTQTSSVAITNASGGGAIGVTALAFNPTNGILYGVSSRSTANGNTLASTLLTIDPVTGVATVIAPLSGSGTTPGVGDATFASDGTLYGLETQGTLSLATITLSGPNAGHLNTIGNSGLTNILGDGIALSPTDSNTIYSSNSGVDPSVPGTLDTFNRTTGALTTGPTMTGAPFPLGSLNALAFFGNTLYGSNSNQHNPQDTLDPNVVDLVTINVVSGAIHTEFQLPQFTDAIAFAPVPEPSAVSLLILGAAGSAGIAIRRRRR